MWLPTGSRGAAATGLLQTDARSFGPATCGVADALARPGLRMTAAAGATFTLWHGAGASTYLRIHTASLRYFRTHALTHFPQVGVTAARVFSCSANAALSGDVVADGLARGCRDGAPAGRHQILRPCNLWRGGRACAAGPQDDSGVGIGHSAARGGRIRTSAHPPGPTTAHALPHSRTSPGRRDCCVAFPAPPMPPCPAMWLPTGSRGLPRRGSCSPTPDPSALQPVAWRTRLRGRASG